MQQATLIAEALNLTLFGMGFVFLFLTLLVFVTKLMSMVLQTSKKTSDNTLNTQDSSIDEETQFVIEQAIKMHRGA